MSRSYTQKTIKILFAESGNLCAFPKCDDQLIEDSVVVCDIAHIIPYSKNGPRGGETTTKDLNMPDNLLLLCLKHHKVIDDKADDHSIDKLRKYKTDHIAKIKKLGQIFEPPDEIIEKALTQFNINISGDVIGSALMTLSGNANQTSMTVFNFIGADEKLTAQAIQEYNQSVRSRTGELSKELQNISIDEATLVSALRDPNIFDFVQKSFSSASLVDEPELYKILAKAIDARIKNNDSDGVRKDVAFSQVPDLINRLTLNQMKLIAIHYVTTNLSVTRSPNIEFVNTTFAQIINPIGSINFHENDILQIGGTSAGTFLSFMENKAFGRIRQQYDHLLMKPIPAQSVTDSEISPEIIKAFLREEDDGYVLAQPLASIEEYLLHNSQFVGLEPIKQLHQMHKMSDEEAMEFLKAHAPAIYRMIDINDSTALSNLNLSLPGKALALAVLEGFTGQSLGNVWVSDQDQKQFPL